MLLHGNKQNTQKCNSHMFCVIWGANCLVGAQQFYYNFWTQLKTMLQSEPVAILSVQKFCGNMLRVLVITCSTI